MRFLCGHFPPFFKHMRSFPHAVHKIQSSHTSHEREIRAPLADKHRLSIPQLRTSDSVRMFAAPVEGRGYFALLYRLNYKRWRSIWILLRILWVEVLDKSRFRPLSCNAEQIGSTIVQQNAKTASPKVRDDPDRRIFAWILSFFSAHAVCLTLSKI
jgi:hypothetical protein